MPDSSRDGGDLPLHATAIRIFEPSLPGPALPELRCRSLVRLGPCPPAPSRCCTRWPSRLSAKELDRSLSRTAEKPCPGLTRPQRKRLFSRSDEPPWQRSSGPLPAKNARASFTLVGLVLDGRRRTWPELMRPPAHPIPPPIVRRDVAMTRGWRKNTKVANVAEVRYFGEGPHPVGARRSLPSARFPPPSRHRRPRKLGPATLTTSRPGRPRPRAAAGEGGREKEARLGVALAPSKRANVMKSAGCASARSVPSRLPSPARADKTPSASRPACRRG